jgi:hypothetical protein
MERYRPSVTFFIPSLTDLIPLRSWHSTGIDCPAARQKQKKEEHSSGYMLA